MNKNLHDTIKTTVIIVSIVAVFLLILSSYERSTAVAPEIRHAMEASYGEEPKPEGHGR